MRDAVRDVSRTDSASDSDPMTVFCTYFDANYLVRGLTMAGSLRQHVPGALRLYVLCLDDRTHECLTALAWPHVLPVRLSDLERDRPALLAAKHNRPRVEYYFTCTPVWIGYLLERCPDADSVTYVDADLFFYSSVQPIYDAMQDKSVLVIPHRFPARLAHLAKFGLYNVAFQVFRRGGEAAACLEAWSQACLASCAEDADAGRFGDQRYLDDWTDRFKSVHILSHVGADVAPWNVEQYALTGHQGRVQVDGQPLIFYHFQGYRQLSPAFIDPGLDCHGWECPPAVVRRVHLPYIRAMLATKRRLIQAGWGADLGRGETRGYASGGDLGRTSRRYRLRFLLEGRAVYGAGRTVFYSGTRLLRRLFGAIDAVRHPVRQAAS